METEIQILSASKKKVSAEPAYEFKRKLPGPERYFYDAPDREVQIDQQNVRKPHPANVKVRPDYPAPDSRWKQRVASIETTQWVNKHYIPKTPFEDYQQERNVDFNPSSKYSVVCPNQGPLRKTGNKIIRLDTEKAPGSQPPQKVQLSRTFDMQAPYRVGSQAEERVINSVFGSVKRGDMKASSGGDGQPRKQQAPASNAGVEETSYYKEKAALIEEASKAFKQAVDQRNYALCHIKISRYTNIQGDPYRLELFPALRNFKPKFLLFVKEQEQIIPSLARLHVEYDEQSGRYGLEVASAPSDVGKHLVLIIYQQPGVQQIVQLTRDPVVQV